METFFRGYVTIDEQMYLVKEDTTFYNFIGLDIYAPITERIHPEDVDNLKRCLSDITSGKIERNATVLRIRGREQDYAWFSVEVFPESFKMYNRRMFNLRLVNMDEAAAQTDQMRDDGVIGLTLLSLTGDIYLIYDIAADYLEVFNICGNHKMNIYTGSLDNWQTVFMGGHVKNAGQLNRLCIGLRLGTPLEDKLTTNVFSEDGTTQVYNLKVQPLNNGNRKRSAGILSLASGASTTSVIYEMDAGINILNKKSITTYAKNVILQAKGRKIYLAIIDLDNFKTINDKFGHMFGDEVLAVVADVVKEAVADNGLVGRIGGDEMFVVIDKVDDHEEIRNIMRNIRTNVEWYYKGKRDDVNLSCSIGVAQYPLAGNDYDTVFGVADKMLYRAKEKGRNRYIIYNPEIHGDLSGLMGESEKKGNAVANLSTSTNDINVFNRLLGDYLVRRNITNEDAFAAIANVCGVDDIVFYNEQIKFAMEWTHAGFSSSSEDINPLALTEDFLSEFDENNMFIMNGSYNLKKDSEYVKEFAERKIKSAIFVKVVRDGGYAGYVMFAKENIRQQWSKYEITSVAVAAKVIELVVMG